MLCRDPAGDPIREATIGALQRLLEPLLDLMFDAGITVQEFNGLVRKAAVAGATKRVTKELGRESKSRVAIMTGLPRSEVARILRAAGSGATRKPDQHPARRVLAAWYDDARFLTPQGDPAVLPIFGRKRSFEALVAIYGTGLPVRAMLDELTRTGAVELLCDQRILAKSRVPVHTGSSGRSIAAVGERGKDLLATLSHNVHRRLQPLFEATAEIDDADAQMVPRVRREITEQGTSFINAADSLLNRALYKRAAGNVRSSSKLRIGVTVYYFEDAATDANDANLAAEYGRRRNLRRNAGKRKKSAREE